MEQHPGAYRSASDRCSASGGLSNCESRRITDMLYNQEWDKQTPTLMSKLLDTAADLIEQYGHTKKQLYGKDGSMCFMGAIHRAEDMVGLSGKIMRGEMAEHVMK